MPCEVSALGVDYSEVPEESDIYSVRQAQDLRRELEAVSCNKGLKNADQKN